jgi:hypothetical protein
MHCLEVRLTKCHIITRMTGKPGLIKTYTDIARAIGPCMSINMGDHINFLLLLMEFEIKITDHRF